MNGTDEKIAARKELGKLSELALELVGDRCELAIEVATLYGEMKRLNDQIVKIGQELTLLSAQEMDVNRKRKELARLVLDSGLDGMDVV